MKYGQWLNPDGYDDPVRETVWWPNPLRWSPWNITMHEVTLEESGPLTYQMMTDSPVALIQMDRHGRRSDGGSIPPLFGLRAMFPHDECERSYYMHDSACVDHGLYFSGIGGMTGEFTFCPMPRRDVHLLLRECFMAEKVLSAMQAGLPLTDARLREYERRAWAVYTAVRLFGPRWGTGSKETS